MHCSSHFSALAPLQTPEIVDPRNSRFANSFDQTTSSNLTQHAQDLRASPRSLACAINMPRRQRSQCLPYFIALVNVLILFDQAHAHLADDAAPAKNNRHTPITDRNDSANQNHRRISQMNPSQRSPRTPSELHELIDTLESKAAEAAAEHHFMELPGEPRSFTETRSFDNQVAGDNNLNSNNGASKVMPDLRIINGESVSVPFVFILCIILWGTFLIRASLLVTFPYASCSSFFFEQIKYAIITTHNNNNKNNNKRHQKHDIHMQSPSNTTVNTRAVDLSSLPTLFSPQVTALACSSKPH